MARVQFPLGGNVSFGSRDWIPSVTGQGADLYIVSKDRGSDNNDGKALDRTSDDSRPMVEESPADVPAGAVNVNKRRIAIVGDARNAGSTVIGHDGTTARASVYVGDGFVNGFALANVSVTTNTASGTELARPCVHLVTNDTATTGGAESADYHFYGYLHEL